MINAFGVEVSKKLPSALRRGILAVESSKVPGDQVTRNMISALRGKHEAGKEAGRQAREVARNMQIARNPAHSKRALAESRDRHKYTLGAISRYAQARKQGIKASVEREGIIRANEWFNLYTGKGNKTRATRPIGRFQAYETSAKLKAMRSNPDMTPDQKLRILRG